MDQQKNHLPYTLAIITGMGVWFLITWISGRNEAWDAPQYWSIGVPVSFIVSAALGYVWPEKSWRWPLALFLSQMPAMWIVSGEIGNLWPLGLVMLCIYSLPGIACALCGGWLAKKFRE